MRRIFSVQENALNIKWHQDSMYKNTILRESDIIEEFMTESVTNPDGSDSISIIDPIYILFNQQRLESMGLSAAQHLLDSLTPKSDSLAELRNKCSDSDLISLLKSRHLQSPAEILAYCKYIESNVEQFNSDLLAAQLPIVKPIDSPSNTE